MRHLWDHPDLAAFLLLVALLLAIAYLARTHA